MRLTLAELATHKVFAQFRTGDTVTIIVYDRTSSLTPALTSAACAEIGATGIFEWNFSQLVAQPVTSKQYVWVMSDVPGTTQTGTLMAGGYPDDLEDDLGVIDTNVDAILVDTGTTLPADLTTIEGKVDVIDGIVDSILVDTGTTIPADLTTIEGKVDVVDGVVDLILIDTTRVDGLIEDDGAGNDRYTAKALEEAPISSLTGDEVVQYSGLRFAMARFTTGDSVTIKVYNPVTEAEVGIQSDACTEIGSTGYFYWSTKYLTHGEQDTYLWVMDNAITTRAGEFNFGDYGDDALSSPKNPLYRFKTS